MAFTLDQAWVHADTAFAAPTSLSKALVSAPAAGDLIVLPFWINTGGAGLSGVSDDMTDGGSWAVALTGIAMINSSKAYVYYKVVGASANSNKTITVTMNTNLDMELFAGVYRPSGTAAADGTAASASGNDTVPTPGSITLTTSAGVVVGFGRTDGNVLTAGTGFTKRSTGGLSFYASIEDQITSASGSYTADWSAASGLWTALVVGFKDTSAATGGGMLVNRVALAGTLVGGTLTG